VSALIYGPDAFTVGSDTNLITYDANWDVVNSGTHQLHILAATDKVYTNASINGVSRWTGQTVLDQKIVSDIDIGSTGQWPGLVLRCDADQNCYYIEWDSAENGIYLYRATGFTGGSGGSYNQIAFGGSVSATTYTNAYAKVTGTNPCAIELGDDTNGPAIVTYNDSDAARLQSGQPGLNVGATVDLSNHDNVEIWDEAATAGGGLAWITA